MTTLHLALLVVLAAPGTPARNARPAQRESAPAQSDSQPSLSDEEVAENVRTYLGAIDTPISADQWKALGSRAVPALESVLRDPDGLPSRRARAVGALSMIGGKRAKTLVLETARSDQEPFSVRASAIRGAPRVVASSDLPAELQPILEKARDAPVRATAAEVLARHAGPSACKAVRAQVDRETGPHRAQFARALERCPPLP